MWSIVALVASIVIGGVMLGMAGVYGSRAFTGSGTETAITDAADIWSNVRSVYGGTAVGGAPNFSTASNFEIIRAGAVPLTMLNGDGNSITGPWGNPITVYGSGDGVTFYQSWNGVPSSACAKLALSQKVNFLNINGTGIGNPGGGGNTASQVARACNQGAGSTSSILFSYILSYD